LRLLAKKQGSQNFEIAREGGLTLKLDGDFSFNEKEQKYYYKVDPGFKKLVLFEKGKFTE
jgi:hypothetical protein